jgi:hypothetical protein
VRDAQCCVSGRRYDAAMQAEIESMIRAQCRMPLAA